jgi:hypothetical protein
MLLIRNIRKNFLPLFGRFCMLVFFVLGKILQRIKQKVLKVVDKKFVYSNSLTYQLRLFQTFFDHRHIYKSLGGHLGTHVVKNSK